MTPGADERGVLHVPLALTFVILTAASLLTWGFLRHWRHLMETQLRLDRCVAQATYGLRARLESIDAVNARIEKLRAALLVALDPGLQASLRAALSAEAAHAEILMKAHDFKRAAWALERGCGEAGDLAAPLPALPWITDPPDPLGPRPLRWPPGWPRDFHIQADHPPRHAASRVESDSPEGGLHANPVWHARWAPPGRSAGYSTVP